MQVLSSRQRTFFVKNHWPHPINGWTATPETLSKAGFYFSPVKSNKSSDKVTCYLCGKSKSGWTQNEIPSVEHEKLSPDCPLVLIMESASSPPSVTTSKLLESARAASFGEWWPHETNRNLNSKKMAKAGFVYFPSTDSDDQVKCCYCELELDGWEDSDDPIVEHSRRNAKCPFFAKPSGPKSKKRPDAKTISEELPASQKPKRARKGVSSDVSPAPDVTLDQSVISSDSVSTADISIASTVDSSMLSADTSYVRRSTRRRNNQTDSHNSSILSEISVISESLPEPKRPRRAANKKKQKIEEVDAVTEDLLESEGFTQLSIPIAQDEPQKDDVNIIEGITDVVQEPLVEQIALKETKLSKPRKKQAKSTTIAKKTRARKQKDLPIEIIEEQSRDCPEVLDISKQDDSQTFCEIDEKSVIGAVASQEGSKKRQSLEAVEVMLIRNKVEVQKPTVQESTKEEQIGLVKSKQEDNELKLKKSIGVGPEQSLDITVEKYLRQMHAEELKRMTLETSKMLEAFSAYYQDEIEKFKQSVEIIDL